MIENMESAKRLCYRTPPTVVGRASSKTQSVREPLRSGTRTAMPFSLPLSSGKMSAMALALPVEVGARLHRSIEEIPRSAAGVPQEGSGEPGRA